jgi:acetoacetyl-CoA reductase
MARIALVCGGTSGIGRAIAVALKAGRCNVAAVYRGNNEAAKQHLMSNPK